MQILQSHRRAVPLGPRIRSPRLPIRHRRYTGKQHTARPALPTRQPVRHLSRVRPVDRDQRPGDLGVPDQLPNHRESARRLHILHLLRLRRAVHRGRPRLRAHEHRAAAPRALIRKRHPARRRRQPVLAGEMAEPHGGRGDDARGDDVRQ